MFLESSRYYNQKQVSLISNKGEQIKALKLRRLPTTEGKPYVVKSDDRLDIISHRQYGDATQFWHIADGNTELDACKLISKPGKQINVPA